MGVAVALLVIGFISLVDARATARPVDILAQPRRPFSNLPHHSNGRLFALRGGVNNNGGPLKQASDAIESLRTRVLKPLLEKFSSTYNRMQPRARIIVVFAFGIVAGVLIGASADSFEIYPTVDDIPGRYFRQQREIPCMVVSVTDGDTVRVMHTPIFSAPRRALDQRIRMSAGKKAAKLSETTMQVRLAAVDTPEVAKFGKTAQPFAEEAKAYVKKRVLGHRVYVKLLSRDQYGRAVASIKYKQGFLPISRDLAEDLLSDGLAVVYRQGGAQYDSSEGVEKWNRIEASAKARGRGMWASGSGGKVLELPSDYKRRMRASGTVATSRR